MCVRAARGVEKEKGGAADEAWALVCVWSHLLGMLCTFAIKKTVTFRERGNEKVVGREGGREKEE